MRVTYGVWTTQVDVTQTFKELFVDPKGNVTVVGGRFNDHFGDPVPNRHKQLFLFRDDGSVCHTIDEHVVEEYIPAETFVPTLTSTYVRITAMKPNPVDRYIRTPNAYPSNELFIAPPVPPDIPSKPTHVYIHVALINNWHDVLVHLLTQCRRFLPESTTIDVVGLGADKHVPKLETLLTTFPQAALRHHAVDMSNYERPTLGLMWDDAHTFASDTRILYLHTKGVSDRHLDAPNLRHNIRIWVDFMLYHLVERYSVALASLETADTCGVLLRKRPSLHFHGNFWWATAEHVRKLSRTITKEYHAPEMWINSIVNTRTVTLAQTNVEHYRYGILPNRVAKVCPRSIVRLGKVDVK